MENNGQNIDLNENIPMDNDYGTDLDDDTNTEPTAMYRQLNMTPEQIARFEKENPNFRDSIGNSQYGRNATIDNSLRRILDDGQYREYETLRDNRTSENPNNMDNNRNNNNN